MRPRTACITLPDKPHSVSAPLVVSDVTPECVRITPSSRSSSVSARSSTSASITMPGSASGPRPRATSVTALTSDALDTTSRDATLAWVMKVEKDRGRPWTHLVHWTFRRDMPVRHALSASQRFRRWCWAWCATDGVRTIRLLLWSVERTSRDAVHGHALWVHTGRVCVGHSRATSRRELLGPCSNRRCRRAMRLEPAWRRFKESWYAHAGIMRCEPYKPALKFGAERYVLKYVMDEKCLDWGLEVW